MAQIGERKPVIYLAGDSTMQSYKSEKRPQYGWGELLLEYLDESSTYRITHRADCPFEQEMCYESCCLKVDNVAMAGCSTRTFREEGRLADIEAHIEEGDYLFVQFGHNDACASKLERYVPVEQFGKFLEPFVNMAVCHSATPILFSAITLCPCKENKVGEIGEIGRILPQYAKAMEEFAHKSGIAYVDMGHLTQELCGKLGEEQTEKLYKSDYVHLIKAGASAYAKLAADAVKTLDIANGRKREV